MCKRVGCTVPHCTLDRWIILNSRSILPSLFFSRNSEFNFFGTHTLCFSSVIYFYILFILTSLNFHFCFCFITYSCYSYSGCAGGDNANGFQYVRGTGGITTADEYEYNINDRTCDNSKRNFLVTVTESYTVSGESAMINHVMNVGPLNVYFDASATYYYTGGIFDACSPNININHAVNIVGVNLNERYWIIRNTWGTQWGEQGYMRLALVSTYKHTFIRTYIRTNTSWNSLHLSKLLYLFTCYSFIYVAFLHYFYFEHTSLYHLIYSLFIYSFVCWLTYHLLSSLINLLTLFVTYLSLI